jgi:hypothetical protein
MTLELSPKNNLWATIYIPTVSPTDGVESGLSTGTVTAFLAVSDDPDVIAADATLSVSCTHIGQANPTAGQFPTGTWLIAFPKSVLTSAILDLYFTDTAPYLIVEHSTTMRVETKLRYKRSRKADLG